MTDAVFVLFYPTSSTNLAARDAAYRRHFRDWNLHRNANDADYRYLAMVIRDRRLHAAKPHQRPTFWVYGRHLSYYEVQRALKRLHISLDTLGVTQPKPAHIHIQEPAQPPAPPLVTPTDLAWPELALRETKKIYTFPFIHVRAGQQHLRKCQDAYGWTLQAINQSDWNTAREHMFNALEQLASASKQQSLHLFPLICFAAVQAQADPSPDARAWLEKFLQEALK